MSFLNTSNVSTNLILTGREFQVLGQRKAGLFVPNSEEFDGDTMRLF